MLKTKQYTSLWTQLFKPAVALLLLLTTTICQADVVVGVLAPQLIAANTARIANYPLIDASSSSLATTEAATETTVDTWQGKQIANNRWHTVKQAAKWTAKGIQKLFASGTVVAGMMAAGAWSQKEAVGHNMGGHNTTKQSPENHNNNFGSTSTFANMMKAYKQPNKVCSGKGDNKQCYNSTNAGTMNNHLKLKNKAHKKAAEQYGNYSTGGATGIAKPSKKWNANSSTIKYHSWYKTMAAIGSHSTYQKAEDYGQRLITKTEKDIKHSMLSIYDKSRRELTQAESKLTNFIFGTYYSMQKALMKIPATMHTIDTKISQDLSQGLSKTVSLFNIIKQKTVGNQRFEDAINEISGETNKKVPW